MFFFGTLPTAAVAVLIGAIILYYGARYFPVVVGVALGVFINFLPDDWQPVGMLFFLSFLIFAGVVATISLDRTQISSFAIAMIYLIVLGVVTVVVALFLIEVVYSGSDATPVEIAIKNLDAQDTLERTIDLEWKVGKYIFCIIGVLFLLTKTSILKDQKSTHSPKS